ncbi:Uncharacterised protein [Actinobacillus equuli]|nr:Uncharacterised protein [Actinobacillus equuli]
MIFSNTSLLDFPKIYITDSQLTLLQENFPHIEQPIPHLQKRQIKYLNNELYYVCYFLENSQTIPRNNLDRFVEIIEQYLNDFFSKLVDKSIMLKNMQ